MRILTVRQPWAWAIIHDGKDVENRTRNLAGDYRGPVAIHVALTDDDDWDDRDASAFIGNCCPDARLGSHSSYRCEWCTTIPPLIWTQHGQIIGVVDLTDVHDADECIGGGYVLCSIWAELEAKHLVLANPRPLTTPLPYRGALGLRTLPADVVAEIERRLA